VDKKGRKRHRKRAMPAGLSKRDERILVRGEAVSAAGAVA
jgi:hypothetical protein